MRPVSIAFQLVAVNRSCLSPVKTLYIVIAQLQVPVDINEQRITAAKYAGVAAADQ
jgi:hypothetical protein